MSAAKNRNWGKHNFFSACHALLAQRNLAWQLYIADVAESKRSLGLGHISPFFSVLVHVLLLGSVMGLVFHEPLQTFIPFFAISFALWQGISIFISNVSYANERAARYLSFPNVSGLITNLMLIYEFAVVVFLKLTASFIIIAFLNREIITNANYFAFLCGLMLLVSLLGSWSLPLSYLFDRFRLLRGFLPQILFAVYLITPILWTTERLQSRPWVFNFNPVYHLIEVVRAPVQNGSLPLTSSLVCLSFMAIGIFFSYLLYPANRNLVAYRWIV